MRRAAPNERRRRSAPGSASARIGCCATRSASASPRATCAMLDVAKTHAVTLAVTRTMLRRLWGATFDEHLRSRHEIAAAGSKAVSSRLIHKKGEKAFSSVPNSLSEWPRVPRGGVATRGDGRDTREREVRRERARGKFESTRTRRDDAGVARARTRRRGDSFPDEASPRDGDGGRLACRSSTRQETHVEFRGPAREEVHEEDEEDDGRDERVVVVQGRFRVQGRVAHVGVERDVGGGGERGRGRAGIRAPRRPRRPSRGAEVRVERPP